MKTITVSKRARGINGLLKQARRENLIVRSADGREFIVAEINDFNEEIELTRKNKKLMKLLDRRAKQSKTIPLEGVKARLGLND